MLASPRILCLRFVASRLFFLFFLRREAAASAMEAMKTAMLMASSTAGGKGGKGGKASHQSLSQAVEAALVVEGLRRPQLVLAARRPSSAA